MKKLELKTLGVLELDAKEMRETDGGVIPWGLYAAAAAAAIATYDAVKDFSKGFVKGFEKNGK